MFSNRSFSVVWILPCLWSPGEANLSAPSALRGPMRDLQEKASTAVTLLEPGDGVHTVRVSQPVVGSPDDGCDDPADTARIMFAIFLDPDTLEETCGLFKRNVSPCFQKTLAIGCSPITNKASITLYVRDKSLPRSMRAENPKFGRCTFGGRDVVPQTLLITETFDCDGPGPGGVNPSPCSGADDECPDGTFCNYLGEEGYECKPYSSVGAQCGGYTIPGATRRCDPAEAYCRSTDYCIVSDRPGTCAAFFGDCSEDVPCSDPSTLFCDVEAKKCKEKLSLDECCDAFGADSCGSDLVCSSLTGRCVTSEEGTDELPCFPQCPMDQECASDLNGTFFCRPFLATGDTCGIYRSPEFPNSCNPYEAFCDLGATCVTANITGTCVEYTSEEKVCASFDDCATTDEYCDDGALHCRPRKGEDNCCFSTEECAEDLLCIKFYFDEFDEWQGICRPTCETTEDCPAGEWCAFSGGRDDPYFCKPYAEEGDPCEFFTMASLYEVCDPSTHFCLDTFPCIIADGGGTCVALRGPCQTIADCADPALEYCDTSIGRCKPRREEGFCCDPEIEDQCVTEFPCNEGFCGSSPIVTLPEICSSNQSCGGIAGLECSCACKGTDIPICIDDPNSDCAENGGADCSGICTCTTNPTCENEFCGGFAGVECSCGCNGNEVATCVDDPNDECDPLNGGADCGGMCVCAEKPTCNNDFCGGIAGFECSCGCEGGAVPMCMDNPNDECDVENGGADCGGICTCQDPVDICDSQFCGGFAGVECLCGCKGDDVATCVENPNDECDPLNGGFDCGGICLCETLET